MFRNFKIIFLICLISLCIIDSAFGQNEWNTFRDNNQKFRLLYPSDWIKGTPRGANVKLSLFAPQGFPRANFNIVVRSFPDIAGMPQKQLDEEISAGGPFSAADWKEMIGGEWPEMNLLETKLVKVDNQLAYFGFMEFRHETLDRNTYLKYMLLMTFTPGKSWFLTCSAKGSTKEESGRSFNHWESTFQRMMGSLVFERW
jgi:hypothetical protein